MSDDGSPPGPGFGDGRGQDRVEHSRQHAGRPERDVLDLLQRVHARLAARADSLAVDDIDRRSYCSEWSVAQVYSHLGSGAEIGALALGAARQGGPPPDPWPVWNRWDAKTPAEMVADFVPADSAYLDALHEAVAAVESGEGLQIPIDGRPWPLVFALTARLVELALHEWDVAVVDDPDAEVDADAAAWTLVTFPLEVAAQAIAPAVAARLAPRRLEIEISNPGDRLRLDLLESGARLRRTPQRTEERDATLKLPHAAAWTRLISGRWRPGVDDVRSRLSGDLAPEDLPELFPGF